ncbi:uncharacterized protein PG986_001517 [Apiospora aurea]|uniref:Inosine/uridine-preferring nucleoside hydrolase domain-containing protein n=1 Tax=Apiospora aurea TaxID=335848 RepID=A0ABR1QX10_9PEZI
MYFSNLVLATTAVVAGATGAAAATAGQQQQQQRSVPGSGYVASNSTSSNSTAGNGDGKPRKMILDNDWAAVAFIPILQALDAGWDVVGIVGDTADSWALQTSMHGLAGLELGNLSECIPVHKGADYPLLNTPELFQVWSTLHGKLPWEGAFAPENKTAEDLGGEPTSGDPRRLSKAAFAEGFPKGHLAGEHAAAWMVEQVRAHPGEILIYSGGAFTNIALAVRMDPAFASLTRGLVVMGGYIDSVLLGAATGRTLLQADYVSDINLKIDPEAAKIALTADFPEITIVGNGANQVFPDQQFLDELVEVENPYTTLLHGHTDMTLPYWDETAMYAFLYPEHVKDSVSFYLDVDTAWSSPYYGNIIGYQEALKPKAQKLQKVNYILEVDGEDFKTSVKRAVQHPKKCPL